MNKLNKEKNLRYLFKSILEMKNQKSGINKERLSDFYKFCKNLNLDIIGTMCIPPNDDNTEKYFSEMSKINQELILKN